MTWQFQVGSLAKKHSDYIPDLFFFGGSYSDKSDRSPAFQAHCLSLRILGVDIFFLVGFSYGGMVAFKIVEEYPEMVRAMVVSGIYHIFGYLIESNLNQIGFESSEDLLLPTSVKGLKTPFALAVHKSMWFPNRLFKDYLKSIFFIQHQTYSFYSIFGVVLCHETSNLEHLQKKLYNSKYKVFCSPKRNFKTSNLKLHLFICILVLTIIHHI
ncbi:hypothetical protein Bca52824_060378 [Brassica carinata]|uniref:AB hydrolase-1 domain-containing protein n=1 Tax=Brassica carinata TaxID=52824 RepID=A0A8X7QW17_BRACI|nr:hypothetical protein Bca52824_060378 [Brassica carinata]